jgi:hypothetical protein
MMADGLVALSAVFFCGFVVGWILAPALNFDEDDRRKDRR